MMNMSTFKSVIHNCVVFMLYQYVELCGTLTKHMCLKLYTIIICILYIPVYSLQIIQSIFQCRFLCTALTHSFVVLDGRGKFVFKILNTIVTPIRHILDLVIFIFYRQGWGDWDMVTGIGRCLKPGSVWCLVA